MLSQMIFRIVYLIEQIIVDGAVLLAQSSVDALNARGIKLTEEQKATLMANLLTVLCSTEADNA